MLLSATLVVGGIVGVVVKPPSVPAEPTEDNVARERPPACLRPPFGYMNLPERRRV